MGDSNLLEVEQPLEHLESQYFQFQPRHLSLVAVLLDGFVQIAGEVVHHNVEVLLLTLVGKKTVTDLEDIGVVQPLQDLQLTILVFLVLEHALDRHHLQRLFVPGLMHHSESTTPHLVLHLVPGRTRKAARVVGLIPTVQGQGGSFFVEDALDGCLVGVGESVSIFVVGVQFGCGVFEGNRLDGFGPLGSEVVALIVGFLEFLEGQFPPRDLVKAALFGVLVHLGADPSDGLLLGPSDLHLQVAYHSTNTIISKVRKLNNQTTHNHHFISKAVIYHHSPPNDRRSLLNPSHLSRLSFLFTLKERLYINTMNQTPTAKVEYLKCSRAGLHQNQSLNVVCLEKGCLQNLVCCCACLESDHKKHRTKPMKMVIHDAHSLSSTLKRYNINIDIMLDIAKTHQKESYQLFQDYRRDILTNLDTIQSALQGYFSLTIDQILLHNSDNNVLIEEVFDRAAAPKDIDQLKTTMKKIVALLGENSKGQELTEDELKASLAEASDSITRSIRSSMEEVNAKLGKYHSSITQLINSTNIWQKAYRFSPTLKHADVSLVNENTAKATLGAGYKFVLLEPGLGKAPVKTFSFRIKESSSNWLAIGFCYRKVVEKNKFSFVFGAINQGGYMVSSNGGSWSHSRPQYNNTLKSIKFGKGDVVTATVDQQANSILFTNKAGQKYELPYDPVDNDELHPCALFYYINDEVEYVQGQTS